MFCYKFRLQNNDKRHFRSKIGVIIDNYWMNIYGDPQKLSDDPKLMRGIMKCVLSHQETLSVDDLQKLHARPGQSREKMQLFKWSFIVSGWAEHRHSLANNILCRLLRYTLLILLLLTLSNSRYWLWTITIEYHDVRSV